MVHITSNAMNRNSWFHGRGIFLFQVLFVATTAVWSFNQQQGTFPCDSSLVLSLEKNHKNAEPSRALEVQQQKEENEPTLLSAAIVPDSPLPQPHVRPSLSPAALNQWCPFAKCHTSSVCHACTRRYLILIAPGRSASTTLQNMLGSLPGIRMSGENNGMLTNFMYAVDGTRRKNQWFIAGIAKRDGPWGHEPIDNAAFACVTQQMVETMNPPPKQQQKSNSRDDDETIVGFKTVRFPPGSSRILTGGGGLNIERPSRQPPKHYNNPKLDVIDHVKEAAEFLVESFPCSRVIINVRSNLTDYARSIQKIWASRYDTLAVQQAAEMRHADLLRFYDVLGPQRAHLLDFSEWVSDITKINDMVKWLGYSHDSCKFEKAFEYNTNMYRDGKVKERAVESSCHTLPY